MGRCAVVEGHRVDIWHDHWVLTLTTANVNGIRAALRRGGVDWLSQSRSDVICLQEVRATHEQFHAAIAGSPLAAMSVAHAPAPTLGRAGVAVLAGFPIVAERSEVAHAKGMKGAKTLVGHGRWVEVDLDTPSGLLTVVSAYVHTGDKDTADEPDTPKQLEKYAFLKAMDQRMAQLMASGNDVVIVGDINVAHTEMDIKNWKGNRGRAGFLPQERAHIDGWLRRGWADLGRQHGGDGPGPYTWWSWRGQAFDTDAGWRIDHAYATPDLAERVKSVTVGRAPSYAERWSDHAPVTVAFR